MGLAPGGDLRHGGAHLGPVRQTAPGPGKPRHFGGKALDPVMGHGPGLIKMDTDADVRPRRRRPLAQALPARPVRPIQPHKARGIAAPHRHQRRRVGVVQHLRGPNVPIGLVQQLKRQIGRGPGKAFADLGPDGDEAGALADRVLVDAVIVMPVQLHADARGPGLLGHGGDPVEKTRLDGVGRGGVGVAVPADQEPHPVKAGGVQAGEIRRAYGMVPPSFFLVLQATRQVHARFDWRRHERLRRALGGAAAEGGYGQRQQRCAPQVLRCGDGTHAWSPSAAQRRDLNTLPPPRG